MIVNACMLINNLLSYKHDAEKLAKIGKLRHKKVCLDNTAGLTV